MKRTDSKTNDLLAQVVERFRFHAQKARSGSPPVAEIAGMMCEVELCEMWMLTQIYRERK